MKIGIGRCSVSKLMPFLPESHTYRTVILSPPITPPMSAANGDQ